MKHWLDQTVINKFINQALVKMAHVKVFGYLVNLQYFNKIMQLLKNIHYRNFTVAYAYLLNIPLLSFRKDSIKRMIKCETSFNYGAQ